MEYKRGLVGKEVGTTLGAMDQHATPSDTAPRLGVSPPLSPLRLTIYSAAIVAAAVALCVLAAGAVLLILFATYGHDDFADLMSEYRFDLGLRARVGAVSLSAFYIAMAAATLTAARLISARHWRARLAICPIKRGRGVTLALSLATLAYAATITFAILSAQDHRLVDAGPTDLVLLGTLLTNLCILAPVAEELFFRGWLYTALRGQFAFWPTYLVTTVLFVAIHWYASVTHMLRVIPLALVLGLAREWKGSIKPTWALHAVYNLTIVLITLAET